MALAITTLLILISITIVGYPIWTNRNQSQRIVDPLEEIEEISRRARERLYEEIRILQQEYFLKNISPEEYSMQLNAAREKAASLLVNQQEATQILDTIYSEVNEKFANE